MTTGNQAPFFDEAFFAGASALAAALSAGTSAFADALATEELNDDLEEYHGRFRLNYDWRASDLFFGEYSYSATNYESQLNEDAAIHRR